MSTLCDKLPDAPPGVSPGDIPVDLATRAYIGTSHTPEQRATQEQQFYVRNMGQVWQQLKERAKTPEECGRVGEVFESFRVQWLDRKKTLLVRRSSLVSTLVAGPSNFPVRQQEKRGMAYDKATAEFEVWHNRTLKRALEDVRASVPKVVSGVDPDAMQKLQAKIDKAVRLQGAMKLANSIVRSRASDEKKVERLVAETGLSQGNAQELLKPDFAGRIGFPTYELTNNQANIRRMEGRIVEIGREQEKPAQSREFPGGSIEEDKEAGRLKIVFDSKPDVSVRERLKHAGFRWAPSQGAWQRQLNDAAREAAKRVLGEGAKNPADEGKQPREECPSCGGAILGNPEPGEYNCSGCKARVLVE